MNREGLFRKDGGAGKGQGEAKRGIYSLFPIPCSLLLAAVVTLTLSGCRPGGEEGQPPVQPSGDVREVIRTALMPVQGPVTLHFYRGGSEERAHRETRAILEFAAETAPQISLLDHPLDPENGSENPEPSLGVDHGPVIKIEGVNRGGLFFYGVPERRELQPFLDGILMASGQPVDLPASVETFLSELDQDVLIRIFTTPD